MVNGPRVLLRWWVATAIAACCCGGLAIRAQVSQTHIPATHGTTLTGTAVALPEVLKGKVGVLVVGFSHASQGEVASWGRLLEANYGKSNDVDYFELPMLAATPKMLRGMIMKMMASSVPAAEKPHFVPLLAGEPAWRAAAHYDKPDDAYVLLVDDEGLVLWQIQGEASDPAWSELKKRLAKVFGTDPK
jgi:ATP10 protein